MKKIFKETNTLDKRVEEEFFLSSELMMENAAFGMFAFIKEYYKKDNKITIFCGSGNNGADGYALARLLQEDFDVSIYEVYSPKSELAKLQQKRVKKLGVNFTKTVTKSDVIVDAILGSGQKEKLDESLILLLEQINKTKAFKIACDIPTGIYSKNGFVADVTITMGALKEVLFYDYAKELTGKIVCANLGVGSKFFESQSDTYLLEESDLKLPFRKSKNTNKGDFGYLSVIKGEQAGASTISALAGFNFGAGLVGLVGEVSEKSSPIIMQTTKISPKTTAIIAGMGLGNSSFDKSMFYTLPCVLDADLLYHEEIKEIIEKNQNVVLTPHPKEFVSLLSIFGFGKFSIDDVQKNRFELSRKFTNEVKVTLVLKGANSIISKDGKVYVCNFGNSALAKGGSGDVLAGFIGGLLAQGRNTLNASINAVLAHSLIAKKYKANNYSLTPYDLIEGIKWL